MAERPKTTRREKKRENHSPERSPWLMACANAKARET